MNQFELRRTILQYAYEYREEHPLHLVEIEAMPFIGKVESSSVDSCIKYLQDKRWIQTEDDAWTIISITTSGIDLVEDEEMLNDTFPVKYDMPEHTKQLMDETEELLVRSFPAPLNQIKKAQIFLFNTEPPDCLNSIKESVGAVEGVARIICDKPKAGLSDLVPLLKRSHLGHPAMTKILDSVYGVRSDEPGIGHGASTDSSLGYADAEYILNVCASTIVYLTRKSVKN